MRCCNADFLLFYNQLRVATTLFVKLHILSLLDQGSETPLLNQTYISKCVSVLLNKTKSSDALTTNMRAFYDTHFATFDAFSLRDQHTTLLRSGIISGTAVNQISQDMARAYVTNIEVHCQEHIEDCLKAWRNNRIRLLLTADEHQLRKTKLQQVMKDYRANLATKAPALHALYQHHLEQLQPLLKTETTKIKRKEGTDRPTYSKVQDITRARILFMHQLNRDAAQAQHDLLQSEGVRRDVKLLALLPEAHLRITPFAVDGVTAREFAKQYLPSATPPAGSHTAEMSAADLRHAKKQDEMQAAWPLLLDMAAQQSTSSSQ